MAIIEGVAAIIASEFGGFSSENWVRFHEASTANGLKPSKGGGGYRQSSFKYKDNTYHYNENDWVQLMALGSFTPGTFLTPAKFQTSETIMEKTGEGGIWHDVINKIYHKQDVSDAQMKTALLYYVKNKEALINNPDIFGFANIVNRRTKGDAQSEELAFLEYLRKSKANVLNDLIAFEGYKFENFDRQVVVEINKYLSTSPLPVRYLQKARQAAGSIVVGDQWTWATDSTYGNKSIKNDRIHLVDGSLFVDNVDNYSKPFRLLGKGKSEKDGTNDVKLEEGSKFSKFKVSNIDPDTSDWFDQGPLVSVENAYNSFFLDFFKIVQLTEQGEITYNDAEVKNLYLAAITEYLKSEINGKNAIAGPMNDEEFNLPLKDYIAKKLLDTFRYAAWLTYSKELKDLTDEDIAKTNAQDLAKIAFSNGEKAAEESPFGTPTLDEDETTDEERADRQKFLKQCMLMTRLDDFANENLANINKAIVKGNLIHGKNKPYQNRFYMVQDDPQGDQAAMINKLIIPAGKSIQEFLDMKPSTHAYLIPKLRFYKVYTKKDGSITEFQFHFRNFTDTSRVEKLSNPGVFDRGGDYGVKSFDFSFQGATPATAKNDIKANLSLYFQSFSDFIQKKFTSDDGEKHAFVDLLLLPSGKSKEGSGAPSIF